MMVRRAVLILTFVTAGALSAGAQTVQTDPLQCWWRTSSGAIRIGEPFSVVLTCAVLETDTVTVVADQSRLEPSVVQFPPFEVMGGTHGADLRTDVRRFFQYEYRLRLITENQFGRDVALPDTKISYRVQSKMDQKTSLQGRDQTYVMPAQSIRVLSLVATDAADIRDAATEAFTDLDQRALRANLLTVVGSVLLVLAALVGVLALVRLVSRYRTPTVATDRLITDGTILRGVGREFAAVRRERNSAGWTPELAGRALAALRVVATYALGRKAGHMPAAAAGTAEEGRLILRAGWPRGKRIAVSGAMTQQTVLRELAKASTIAGGRRAVQLDALGQALSTFTTAQYGREGTLEDNALDEALATGGQVLGRMKVEQLWVMRRLAAWRAVSEVESRAWSR